MLKAKSVVVGGVLCALMGGVGAEGLGDSAVWEGPRGVSAEVGGSVGRVRGLFEEGGGVDALEEMGKEMERLGVAEWIDGGVKECGRVLGGGVVDGSWEKMCRILEVVKELTPKEQGSSEAVLMMLRMVIGGEVKGGWSKEMRTVMESLRQGSLKVGGPELMSRVGEKGCGEERVELEGAWRGWEKRSVKWRGDSRFQEVMEGVWGVEVYQVKNEVFAGDANVRSKAGLKKLERRLAEGLAKVKAGDRELDVRKGGLVRELLALGRSAVKWEERCEVECKAVGAGDVMEVVRGVGTGVVGYGQRRVLECYLGG